MHENNNPKKKNKTLKILLITAISIIIIAAVTSAILFAVSPQIKYSREGKLLEDEKFESAIKTYEDLNIKKCLSHRKQVII